LAAVEYTISKGYQGLLEPPQAPGRQKPQDDDWQPEGEVLS
jgi:hypothetical protein